MNKMDEPTVITKFVPFEAVVHSGEMVMPVAEVELTPSETTEKES
jgi:hypothetical protein